MGNARIEDVVYSGDSATSVTVDQPIYGVSIEPRGLGIGDDSYLNDTTVYNDELGSDFLIQDSEFKNSRRFGIYLMSRRGQIVDSAFEGISDQAIAGHNESRWPLGLFPDDILIQNNWFSNNGFSQPYQTDPQFTGMIGFNMDRFSDRVLVDQPASQIADIRILDNVFEKWRKSAIAVRNARGVVISDNIFQSAEPHMAVDPENANLNQAIRIAWSDDVEITGNRSVDLGLNQGFIERLLDADVEVTNLAVSGNSDLRSEQLAKWISWNEASGKIAKDQSAQQQNARLVRADNNAAGHVGKGVSFDGDNQFAFSFDAATVDEKRNRTISLWANLDNGLAEGGKQVLIEDGSINRGMNIYADSGRIFFGNWGSPTDAGAWLSFAIESSRWYHFAVTLSSAGEMRAYVDGREIGFSLASPHGLGTGYLGFAAADRNGTRFHDGIATLGEYSNYFAGRLDETRIYNQALSLTEIQTLSRI